MRSEPHVDALHVELVAAFRQVPPDLAVVESAQADDALEAGVLDGAVVDEERDRGDGGSVEAFGGGGGGGERGEVEDEGGGDREAVVVVVAVEAGGGWAEDAGDGATATVGLGVGVVKEPPGVDVEEEDEEDDQEEGNKCRQHNVAIVGEDALHEVTHPVLLVLLLSRRLVRARRHSVVWTLERSDRVTE